MASRGGILRDESTALVRVDCDLYRSYKALCAKRGVSIAGEVRCFMAAQVKRYQQGGLASFGCMTSACEEAVVSQQESVDEKRDEAALDCQR